MIKPKKILIFSFYFPPSNRIGGRRWSYFIKELLKNGNEVFVICSDFDDTKDGDCPWQEQVSKLPKNHIFCIKHQTPYILLNQNPKSTVEKLKYKASEFVARKKSKADFYDRSLNWKKQAIEKAKEIVQDKRISSIIATGDPFGYFYDLCKEFSTLNSKTSLYIDLRDPWGYGNVFEHRKKLFSEERNNRFINEMKYVFQEAKKVFVPVVEMQSYYINNFPEIADKFVLLNHGFDADTMREIEFRSIRNSAFYAGSIFSGLEEHFRVLGLLSEFMNIDIYGINATTHELRNTKIKFHNPRLQVQLFEDVKDDKFAIILLTEECKDYFSSKFYELLFMKKFIIYIGAEGKVSDFLIANNLGVHLEPSLNKVNSDLFKGTFHIKVEKSLFVDYSYETLTKRLEESLT